MGVLPWYRVASAVEGLGGEMRGLLVGLLVAAVVVAVGSPVVGADATASGPQWSIQQTRHPLVRTGASSAVSCASATACTAVGSHFDSAGATVTLAEEWSGTGWSVQPTPDPPGATASYLYDVACAAANACIAVGTYSNAAGPSLTLAEAWNGTRWSVQPTPNPAGATGSYLYDVACAAANACSAVGYFSTGTGSPVTLAEEWNGTSWSVSSTPNEAGAATDVLEGVSCVSATACTAVGAFSNSDGTPFTLAEAWNGTRWTRQYTPNPIGAAGSVLYDVSCTATTACTAVGYYISIAGAYVTLAEAWNGTRWSRQSAPNPPAAEASLLANVSCTSATACTAVGYYENSVDATVTLAEAWDGTSWSVQPTPNPTRTQGSFLFGVSCASATACTAVGESVNSAGSPVDLAEVWDGTSWSSESIPNPAGATSSILVGVACASAAACTAVGSYLNGSGTFVTLAETWNGTSWSREPTPNPAGAMGSFLYSVSCTSAASCTAVGTYNNSAGATLTLAEAWNGTSWSLQPTPNPTDGQQDVLDGVSCTSSAACTAVGNYATSTGTLVTLAEAWNGTSWSLQSTPNPAGAEGSFLYNLSCTSASACTAVGFSGRSTGSQALAETWNGTSWSVSRTANPRRGELSQLEGVSCTSATACTAVGSFLDSSGFFVTLAEVRNGGSWSVRSTPNATGAEASDLTDVSCSAASACAAVGYYDTPAGASVTLAERWNGSRWSVQSTPDREGAAASVLEGVSCASTAACTAVGYSAHSNGPPVTLAEAYSG
jgi:hypothetical protein